MIKNCLVSFVHLDSLLKGTFSISTKNVHMTAYTKVLRQKSLIGDVY